MPGCATSNIWSEASYYEYESSAVATGLEIYGENPSLLGKYGHPEVRISYTSAQKIMANTPMPSTPEGCIILKQFDDSARFLVGLESLLHATQRSNINSVKAVISHLDPKPGHGPNERYNLRLCVTLQPVNNDLLDETGKPKVDSSWISFLRGSPPQGVAQTAQYYMNNRLNTPLDSFLIPENSEKDTLYFLVGGPSGGGPSGSAQLVFDNECVVKENFLPLLRDETIPFTIQFVEGEEAMKYPLFARIVLTPFTVSFDIITSPIQLILIATAEYWMPR